MAERNQNQYHIEQNNKVYILSTSLIYDKIKIVCEDSNIQIFEGQFTMNDLIKLSKYFRQHTIEQIHVYLNGIIENQRIGITQNNSQFNIILYLVNNDQIIIPLDKKVVNNTISYNNYQYNNQNIQKTNNQHSQNEQNKANYNIYNKFNIQNNNFKNNYENWNKKINNSDNNTNNEIINLRNEIQELKNNIDKFRNEIEVLKNENEVLKNENEVLNKENEVLNKKNKVLNKKNISLKNELTIKNEDINKYKEELNNLKNSLISKDNTINDLNNKISNLNINNNTQNVNINDIKTILFKSVDHKVDIGFSCQDSDIFVRIEEKLYNEYPDYKDLNTYFTVNGLAIKRFRSIKENNLKNFDKIILNVYE